MGEGGRIRLTLQPGQRGTKALVQEYGARLVCVRYRYDDEQRKRYKTVELIVETADWVLPPTAIAPETVVGVQVVWGEIEVARQVRQAGGCWNKGQKVWALRYDQVARLGLTERLVRIAPVTEGVYKHLLVDAKKVYRHRYKVTVQAWSPTTNSCTNKRMDACCMRVFRPAEAEIRSFVAPFVVGRPTAE